MVKKGRFTKKDPNKEVVGKGKLAKKVSHEPRPRFVLRKEKKKA